MWFLCLVLAELSGALPYFVKGDAQWYLSIISRDFTIFIVSLGAIQFIPYDRPYVKMVWGLWTIWQFMIMIFSMVSSVMLPWEGWRVIASFSAIVFISLIFTRRSPKISKIMPENGMVYYVLPNIKNPLGLLIGMFTMPWSGLKVYVNGSLYGFSFGSGFKKRTGNAAFIRVNNSKLVLIRPLQVGDVDFLENHIGDKWLPWRHCHNIFQPTFGKVTKLLYE